MATTGNTLGTGAANVTTVTMTFANTANVLIADDTTSSSGAVATKNAEAHITVSNFGFDSSIPAGATINQVDFLIRGTCTTGASDHSGTIFIGATAGAIIQDNNTSLTTITTLNYARPGGGSWTRADLLNGTLTVQLHSLQPNNTTSRTYQWAWTQINVTYTTASSPTVTTQAVSSIGQITATGNGNVTSDGGATVTERGICWNTVTNPTTANSKATAAGTTGVYTASMTGLTYNTHYFVKAYAINSQGTSYGGEVTFDTTVSKLTGVGSISGLSALTF